MEDSSDEEISAYSCADIAAKYLKHIENLKANPEEDDEEAISISSDEVACKRSRKSKSTPVQTKKVVPETVVLSSDSDSDEPIEETVSAIWCGDFTLVHRFSLKRKDIMKSVFEYYANLHKVDISRISISIKMREVTPYDSLDTLDFRVTDFLDVKLIKEGEIPYLFNYDVFEDSEKLEFKCRMKDSKKPLTFKLHPKQPMHILYRMCAKKLECNIENITLSFDGEVVGQADTVESLGLEGDECFHLYLKSQ